MKKWILMVALAISLTGCKNSKPQDKEALESQQGVNVPILICEKDGVKVYKIRDDTPGGVGFVYFTVPAGHIVSGRPNGD